MQAPSSKSSNSRNAVINSAAVTASYLRGPDGEQRAYKYEQRLEGIRSQSLFSRRVISVGCEKDLLAQRPPRLLNPAAIL